MLGSQFQCGRSSKRRKQNCGTERERGNDDFIIGPKLRLIDIVCLYDNRIWKLFERERASGRADIYVDSDRNRGINVGRFVRPSVIYFRDDASRHDRFYHRVCRHNICGHLLARKEHAFFSMERKEEIESWQVHGVYGVRL